MFKIQGLNARAWFSRSHAAWSFTVESETVATFFFFFFSNKVAGLRVITVARQYWRICTQLWHNRKRGEFIREKMLSKPFHSGTSKRQKGPKFAQPFFIFSFRSFRWRVGKALSNLWLIDTRSVFWNKWYSSGERIAWTPRVTSSWLIGDLKSCDCVYGPIECEHYLFHTSNSSGSPCSECTERGVLSPHQILR